MKKTFKRLAILSIVSLVIFFLYKLFKFWFDFHNTQEENLFSDLKSESFVSENWLLYTGIFLIFVSVLGIISLLFGLSSKKYVKKSKKFNHYKDLYSS